MPADGKTPWYYDAIKTLGVPTVFLFCVLYMLWESGQWAGTTILLPLYQKQSEFIDSATAMTEKMAVTTDEINRTLKAHGEHAVENLRISNALHEVTDSNSKKVSECHQLIQMQIESSKEHQKNVLDVLKKIETNTESM